MPSRRVTIVIVLFWLTTMGWMVSREVWPRFAAGEPPPFELELADEIGRVIKWQVYEGDQLVGDAYTRISRNSDRTFDLQNDISFMNLVIVGARVKKMSSSYRVTPEGQILNCVAAMKFEILTMPHEAEFRGEVRDGVFSPQMTWQGPIFSSVAPPELKPITVTRKSSVVNVLHTQNKIPGLYRGRSWYVPVFNPLAATLPKVGADMNFPDKKATVNDDEIPWSGERTSCWRIDVAEGDKAPDNKIWVRKKDDLVIQHMVQYQGKELTLKRVKTR